MGFTGGCWQGKMSEAPTASPLPGMGIRVHVPPSATELEGGNAFPNCTLPTPWASNTAVQQASTISQHSNLGQTYKKQTAQRKRVKSGVRENGDTVPQAGSASDTDPAKGVKGDREDGEGRMPKPCSRTKMPVGLSPTPTPKAAGVSPGAFPSLAAGGRAAPGTYKCGAR